MDPAPGAPTGRPGGGLPFPAAYSLKRKRQAR